MRERKKESERKQERERQRERQREREREIEKVACGGFELVNFLIGRLPKMPAYTVFCKLPSRMLHTDTNFKEAAIRFKCFHRVFDKIQFNMKWRKHSFFFSLWISGSLVIFFSLTYFFFPTISFVHSVCF